MRKTRRFVTRQNLFAVSLTKSSNGCWAKRQRIANVDKRNERGQWEREQPQTSQLLEDRSPLVRRHASLFLLGCVAAARLDSDRVHAGAAWCGAALESDARGRERSRAWRHHRQSGH